MVYIPTSLSLWRALLQQKWFYGIVRTDTLRESERGYAKISLPRGGYKDEVRLQKKKRKKNEYVLSVIVY